VKFEEAFFNEFSNQHGQVNLFVNSKADEISRWLGKSSTLTAVIYAKACSDFLQKALPRLLARCMYTNGKPISQKRWAKLARYDYRLARSIPPKKTKCCRF
jgi:hypothetical protein